MQRWPMENLSQGEWEWDSKKVIFLQFFLKFLKSPLNTTTQKIFLFGLLYGVTSPKKFFVSVEDETVFHVVIVSQLVILFVKQVGVSLT